MNQKSKLLTLKEATALRRELEELRKKVTKEDRHVEKARMNARISVIIKRLEKARNG